MSLSLRNAAAAACITAGLAAAGCGGGHQVSITVPDGTGLVAGQEIRSGGQRVGLLKSIEPADRGGAAKLTFTLEDAAWPLRRGARFRERLGGTASYANRYIALTPGTPGAAPYRDGASLPAHAFVGDVELDDITAAFTPPVRAGLKSLLVEGGAALRPAAPRLRAALTDGPAALAATHRALRDLRAGDDDLATLLSSVSRTVAAVHGADPGLGRLVSGAGTTFEAISAKARPLQRALDHAPETFGQLRLTLTHARSTLAAAGVLTRRIAPGVTQLRRIARPLDQVLATVRDVGPDANAALRAVHRATPSLNPLLQRATTVMPHVASIGKQATTELDCVRPYAPDIAGFASNWADFLSWGDGKDRFIRAQIQNLMPAPINAVGYDSATAAKLFPGLRYAFPRPPGDSAGQPWFQPQCGITKDAYDPAKDPEARTGGHR